MRNREANKIHTPEEMWNRLQPRYRVALSAMGEIHEIGIPNETARHLQSWALIKPSRSGWLLTTWGKQTRDFGRQLNV